VQSNGSTPHAYSGWKQLCVHAQPCMQGSGDTACLLCMLGAVYFTYTHAHLAAVSCTSQANASSLQS
jgi:hypothetical protein